MRIAVASLNTPMNFGAGGSEQQLSDPDMYVSEGCLVVPSRSLALPLHQVKRMKLASTADASTKKKSKDKPNGDPAPVPATQGPGRDPVAK